MREELDAAKRDVYRRVLIRLVQAADRIPDSLWLQIHSLRKNAGALSGAFATVYRGRTVDDEVAIKVPQALISLPDDVSTRRVSRTLMGSLRERYQLFFLLTGGLSRDSIMENHKPRKPATVPRCESSGG